MRLDSHIHAEDDRSFKNDAKTYRSGFLKALEIAGLKGGAVFSVDPLQFPDRLRDIGRRAPSVHRNLAHVELLDILDILRARNLLIVNVT